MTNKKFLIVGNWKMTPSSPHEAAESIKKIRESARGLKNVGLILCPPFVFLERAHKMLSRSKITVGVQNIHSERKGSFTGEISAEMTRNSGAGYVIIGHSERRKLGDTDAIINKKILEAVQADLIPILCIGEEVRDEDGKYLGFLKQQIESALRGLTRAGIESAIIAYEPVWAIGSTQAMAPSDIHETAILIKKTLVDVFKLKTPIATKILYGGAVDAENATSILSYGGVDGLLMGRASQDPKIFSELIRLASKI